MKLIRNTEPLVLIAGFAGVLLALAIPAIIILNVLIPAGVFSGG